MDDVSPYEAMGNNPINDVDPFGDFRTRFGAWLYKLFHGGGEIGRNHLGEYYVAQTKFSSKRGIATLTAKMIYGKGRDKYSAAREKLAREEKERQDINRMIARGVWDPNLSPQEAGRNALSLGLLVTLPELVFKTFSTGAKAGETAVASEVINETTPELQNIARQNAPLFRKLFGVGKTGAQAILDNIENVKVPEGLTKKAMQAYRELINRVPDPTGTQAIRAKILDHFLK